MKKFFHIVFISSVCTMIAIYFNACASLSTKKSENTQVDKANADLQNQAYQYYDHHTLQITSTGENDQAVFSPDMNSIFYVGWNRPTHAHSQIYEINLKNKTEKRITHNDGSINRIVFDSTGKHILYSSTTDELKENQAFLKKMIAEFSNSEDHAKWKQLPGALPPFELYMSKKDGNEIKRLTYSDNFDAEVSVDKKNHLMAFSSVRSGTPHIFLQNLADGRATQMTRGSDGINRFPTISPDGKKIVWTRWNSKQTESQLVVADIDGKNEKVLTTGSFQHLSPVWHPQLSVLIFSANRASPDNFDLYSLDTQNACLKRLTFTNKYNETSPNFSPDGKSLLFTSNATQSSQIFLMKYNPPDVCMGEVL